MASRRSVSAALFDLRTVTITSFIIYVPYRTPSGRVFEDGQKEVDGEIRREMAFDDTFSEPDDAVPSVCDMR